MAVDGIVSIRGKQYSTVSKRVNDFRERYTIADGWGILTSIEHVNGESVIMRAEITNADGRIVAVGYAEEVRTASKINRTSALENAETSAIGRALAACGLGGTSYASANEVQIAIARQESEGVKPAHRWSEREQKAFCAALSAEGIKHDDAAAWTESEGLGRPSGMTVDQRRSIWARLVAELGGA